MNRLAWAKEFFQSDKFATKTTGIQIEAAEGDYARCVLHTTPDHKNAMGGVMGGAIFTLADFTFAVAINTPERKAVSLTSEISYLARAKGDTLIAEATCLKSGKTLSFYTIAVRDEFGTHVANLTATGLFT